MYEHMYPDHASPVSLSEISAAIEETLRDLRGAPLPPGPLSLSFHPSVLNMCSFLGQHFSL